MRLTGESDQAVLIRTQAEAAAWMALLHSPERNAEIEQGLRRWIAADPLHASVWETATDLWNDTANLPRRIPRRPIREARPNRWHKPLLAVAVLCLLAIGVVVQYSLTSTVTTAVGEQRTVTLDDGTRVELNTDSRLQVKFDRGMRSVVLRSGEAYFQVAHERRPFVVIAGERKIVALGTAFTVRKDASSDDAVTVTLIEGRVAVTAVNAENTTASQPGPTIAVLNAGQRLRTRPNAQPKVDSLPIDRATGWMRGQLIFDHTPLSEAAAEFSRYNKMKITVASPEAARIPIGGIFRIGDSRSFARAVAASYDLKVTMHGDELVLEAAHDASSQPDTSVPNP